MRILALLLCCLLTGPVFAEETAGGHVRHAVHKTNRTIGHTTHRTVWAIGHGTRKVTRAIGHGFRDAAHAATGKDK